MRTTSGFIRSVENGDTTISAIPNIYSVDRISFQHKKVRNGHFASFRTLVRAVNRLIGIFFDFRTQCSAQMVRNREKEQIRTIQQYTIMIRIQESHFALYISIEIMVCIQSARATRNPPAPCTIRPRHARSAYFRSMSSSTGQWSLPMISV